MGKNSSDTPFEIVGIYEERLINHNLLTQISLHIWDEGNFFSGKQYRKYVYIILNVILTLPPGCIAEKTEQIIVSRAVHIFLT